MYEKDLFIYWLLILVQFASSVCVCILHICARVNCIDGILDWLCHSYVYDMGMRKKERKHIKVREMKEDIQRRREGEKKLAKERILFTEIKLV